MDETYAYQRWYGETYLHPLGLIAVIVLGCALLFVPRRFAAIPMLIMACFVSPAQQVAVMSLNFDLLRIMVLFGTVRVLFRGEWRGMKWTTLDTAILLWGISATLIYTIQQGTIEALKYKSGVCYDAFGMYFLFRMLIRNWRDVESIARGAAAISVPVAIAFLIEYLTAHNPFAIFGGVREITWVRDGRLRCQGAFAHAILAGCFWAALLPMIVALWWRGRAARLWTIIGTACSFIIIITCASSTPMGALLISVLAALTFPLRRWLRWGRWGVVVLAVLLHLVMKQPIWHLICRIDLAAGSTGYHRFRLIDAAIHHFSEWWVFGTTSTAQWGDQLQDVTNQYVLEGVRGGALTMLLFFVMIGIAFQATGRIIRRSTGDKAALAMSWALGVALTAHCANFIAVSYFGQIDLVWYMLLATIGSLSTVHVRKLALNPTVVAASRSRPPIRGSIGSVALT